MHFLRHVENEASASFSGNLCMSGLFFVQKQKSFVQKMKKTSRRFLSKVPEPFFEIAGIYANKSFNLSRSFSSCNSRIGEEVKGLVVYRIRQCWLNACLSACWEPSTVDYFSVAIVFSNKGRGLIRLPSSFFAVCPRTGIGRLLPYRS